MARTKASAHESLRELAERMHKLFFGFQGTHGTHGEPVQDDKSPKWIIKPSARTVKGAATVDFWEQHLKGSRPLGIGPIDEDGNCRWGCIDIDDYDVNAVAIASRIANSKFPLVPVISKSGGLHLFLFSKDPHPAAEFISILKWFAASLGYGQSEIFPKQTQILHERGDSAIWMVMPYCGTTFNGKLREQTGITAGGGTIGLEEWLDTVDGTIGDKRLSEEEFQELLKKRDRNPPRRGAGTIHTHNGKPTNGSANGSTNGHAASVEDFADGPPCLQIMAEEGFPAGKHNDAVIPVGVYYKKVAAQTGEDWEELLLAANAKYSLNQSLDEMNSAIKSLREKDYFYTCKKEPLHSRCQAKECRRRRFGVGDSSQVLRLTGLVKVTTIPEPIYIVTIDDGAARITCSFEQLRSYEQFTALVGKAIDRNYPPLSKLYSMRDWYADIDNVLESVDTVEPDPDEKYEGFSIKEMIQGWVTKRPASRKEEILNGMPWFDTEGVTFPDGEPRYFFALNDLWQHLFKAGVKDFTNRDLSNIIKKDYEGSDHVFSFLVVKGSDKRKVCRTRWILASKFEPPELPPIPQPRPVL